ncbi:MAG: S-layer homology domain-containing protein [Clostridia bacterium]|nr:S-layer homology domain-containing protein [Clostridia bacterium]
MKRIISVILAALLAAAPVFALADGETAEEETTVKMSITPTTESDVIEVGDQFLVTFTLADIQKYNSFQIEGVFDTEKAQIIAPVYVNDFYILENSFDNVDGTFKLVTIDLSLQGSEDETLCAILFRATAAGEFYVNISGDEFEILVGRMKKGENGELFHDLEINDAVFEITEDSDGENAVIIAEPEPITRFVDMDDYSWAETSVSVLDALGALEDIDGDVFYPGENITRADFVNMMIKTCDLSSSKETEAFGDVDEDEYYYESVMTAKALNLVQGDENNNFNPSDPITREDMCVIMFKTMRYMNKVRAMDDAEQYLNQFPDTDDVSDYAKDGVAGMIRAKIFRGDEAGNIRPKDNMTRAEAAVALLRVAEFNRLISL